MIIVRFNKQNIQWVTSTEMSARLSVPTPNVLAAQVRSKFR